MLESYMQYENIPDDVLEEVRKHYQDNIDVQRLLDLIERRTEERNNMRDKSFYWFEQASKLVTESK